MMSSELEAELRLLRIENQVLKICLKRMQKKWTVFRIEEKISRKQAAKAVKEHEKDESKNSDSD